jgi:hypothetical protein
MKKITTITLGCILALSSSKAQTFSDSFETYTVTTPLLGVQSPNWRTWSSTVGGGSEDVPVVTTDNHTPAGSKSIYFSSTLSTGGPSDVVLPFTSTTPLSTGQFTFTSWFKIPTGKNGYFNFQGNATLGNQYALDCFMTATGAINIENSGTQVATGTHPFGAWFQVTILANLNTNTWELLVNGVSQSVWSNTINQIWGMDIYPTDASSSYWVDDVSYNVAPYTLPALNGALNLIGITNGLVGQTKNPSITVRNLGTSVINSFSLAISHNGGAPVVQSVSGLSLASLTSTVINIATPFTLTAGSNAFSSTITNVNGLGADGDATDNIISKTLTPVTPALGKVVVAEEGTGTWCQWCPRGAVFMDAMNSKYAGYFAPIAVHNGDPMTITSYNAAIGGLISGYPSAIVDRLPEIDPSGIETDFLTRIVIAPKAFVVNGATYNSVTRVLNVSVKSTIQTAITGNYKVACVLTEDSVKGTGASYNQSNAYAGGASGVMGGFELLGNPVPASIMKYDHVARFISPSFAGYPATGASASAGAIFTYTFTFTLPANFNSSKINIVGLFIDPTGKIDNAGTATIAQAVANGFVAGSGVGVGINETPAAPDAQVSIFPNPSANYSSISLNLAKPSSIQLAIYSVNGTLIGNKDYGQLNGNLTLPVDMTQFSSGMYFVNVTINGNTSMHKLIKE